MPSHTVASALVKLYSLNEAPWGWPVWQELTGVRHGLFPDDDNLLPPGWTRQNADDVQSFFHAYDLQPTEEQKLAFSLERNDTFPGREFWKHWVDHNSRIWDVHNTVVDEFHKNGIHPLSILRGNPNAQWPQADYYIPLIVNKLALRIFGAEAFPTFGLILSNHVRNCVLVFARRSWNTIRGEIIVLKRNVGRIERDATAALNGLWAAGIPTVANIYSAILLVAKWRECLALLESEEQAGVVLKILLCLQELLEALSD